MKRKLLLLALSIATVTSVFSTLTGSASAMINGRIIDDGIFNDSVSMTGAQIDSFLNGFPNSCISPNSGFSAIVPTGYSPGGGFTYGGYDTAGMVIATAAQVYGINPKVLITTLQKEQSLVVGGATYCNDGDDHKYAAAVGYGCPDSGTRYSYTGISLYRRNGVVHSVVNPTCVNSAAKAGFSQQIIRAAWLLKFGQQRSLGNVGWSIQHGSWDNSDDPESCYSGPMTEGYRQICPSSSSVYYSGIQNIDGTAVHIDTGATAALYWYTPHFHGNQMFSDYYTQWFGNPLMPYAFKSASSPIYLYVNGYKVAANSMAVLQDYGISPGSIQTISQASVDAIPTPPADQNFSDHLSYLVKSTSDSDADGGSIYLVSVGKKYQITSMTQFADFGFNENNIVYFPLSYINSIPNGKSALSNYISAPNSSTFQVSGGSKRLILDYSTYIGLNPSDNATPVSYFIADLMGSGQPLANKEALIRYNDSQGVFLYASGKYFLIPSMDAFSCWGFDSSLSMPVRVPANNNYIAPISNTANLGCMVNDGTNNFLMSGTNRYTIPPAYGLSTTPTDAAATTVANKLPLSAGNLNQYVKGSTSAGIWYLESGKRRIVPTYSNFSLINPTVSTVQNGALSSIPAQGIKLATGQAVKTDNSSAVYVINGNSRVLFPTYDAYNTYYRNWDAIETYPATTLDQYYPYNNATVQKFFYDSATDATYLIELGACHKLTPALTTAFGQNQATLASAQQYTRTTFPNLNLSKCTDGVAYVKQPDQSLVYWVDNGKKHPVTSWSKLQQATGQQNPDVMTVSQTVLDALTTDTPL